VLTHPTKSITADVLSSAISLALVDGPDSLGYMQKLCEFEFKSIFKKTGGIPAWRETPWNYARRLAQQIAAVKKI